MEVYRWQRQQQHLEAEAIHTAPSPLVAATANDATRRNDEKVNEGKEKRRRKREKARGRTGETKGRQEFHLD